MCYILFTLWYGFCFIERQDEFQIYIKIDIISNGDNGVLEWSQLCRKR